MPDVSELPAHHAAAGEASDKNRTLAAILAFLFGWVGAHRFYAGRPASGVLQLLTFGGLTIWSMIDLVIILFGEFEDGEGRKIRDW